MTDHAELIAQARRYPLYFFLHHQMADALAALVAERDAQAAEVAKLRETLKPFAAWLDVRETQSGMAGNPKQPDDTPVFMAASIAGEAYITAGDLRRARAALAQGGEKP